MNLKAYLKSRLTATESVFSAIAIIAGINALLFIVFGILVNVGLVERLYQVSLIFSPVLTAYFYEKISKNSPRNSKMMLAKRVVSIALLASTFIFVSLSMFTSPAYTGLYNDAFGKPDLVGAKWIAEHFPDLEVCIDGSGRLNQLIALLSYPRHIYGINLTISGTIEVNVIRETYQYPTETLLTTRKPLIKGAGTIPGLSDIMLMRYIKSLPSYLNKIFKQRM